MEAVLAGVAAAKERGVRCYIFILPETSSESNIALEAIVKPLLPDCAVNHMTITHPIRGVEKRLVIDW